VGHSTFIPFEEGDLSELQRKSGPHPRYRENWQTKVSFTVDVTDKGEPGTNDFFSIQFSNGYSASGYPLNCDYLDY